MNVSVIHTIGSLGRNAGGPTRTVPSLCRSLAAADAGVTSEIVTTTDRKFGENLKPEGVTVHTSDANEGSRGLYRLLNRRMEQFDAASTVIHDHGQWLPINRASAALSRKHGIKRVVTPRGMLSPWALGHHRLKKTVAWWWFARRDLQQASLVHATSEQEHDDLRRLGVTAPVLISPNGVDVPEAVERSSNAESPPYVLFLGRLHQVKGIEELVAAWRAVKPAGWELRLAGPDEGNLLDRLAISDSDAIRYLGNVESDEKWRLLKNASLFVLPSHSENFGMAAAESLMAGTPVVATHGTPWQSLVEHRCGWWVEIRELAEALRLATKVDSEELSRMGQRGREHATQSFDWATIAQQMADAYQWLLGFAAKPESVRL